MAAHGALAAALTLILLGTSGTAAGAAPRPPVGRAAALVTDPAAYVDPFIGTGRATGVVGEINNFPGPAVPFGMMQFSPDTLGSYAGYQYHNDRIRGFSLNHASVGCNAFGDVPILPVTGDVGAAPWNRAERYAHATEKAEPGYYAVTLEDSKVRAELTATIRTGLATFTFPPNAAAHVLVKAGASLGGNSGAELTVVGNNRVTGSATTGRFCGKNNKYTVYYAIEFDRPFTAHGTWDGTTVTPGGGTASGAKAGGYLRFNPGLTVRAKVSMSYVSVDGARANMAAEVPGWDPAPIRASARAKWTEALGRIRVSADDTARLKTFYTALYHSLMHPNTFNDVDGRYIGFDNAIHKLPAGRTQYANFSDWDTYRSLAPLQAMMWPKEASDMAQSLVNDAVQGGWWPRWPLANGYTGQMTGDNSVPLIANLYAYGATNFDLNTALQYLVKGATTVDETPGAYKERPDIGSYIARGYAPNTDASRGDHQRVGGSLTLEWSIDDFAISELARAAGRPDLERQFAIRGQNWQNILNPTTDYLSPRGADGRFQDGPGFVPPPPGRFGQDGFDEGNAAQYNWLVPQNMAGLITAMGGREAVISRLDTFFTKINAGPNEPYMWAGNEVNFGVPWVYNYLGQPWRTQQVVRQIATTLFGPTPNGEPGNDDLGAQSSWYVWAALGLYPATPGTADLAVHNPMFARAVLDLPGSRDLDIRAPRAATGGYYVHRLRLDGLEWNHSFLPRAVVSQGGLVEVDLLPTQSKVWATAANSVPPSYRAHEAAFLANVSPGLNVVEQGSTGGQLFVDGQRLAGTDSQLTVAVTAPPGITVTPASSTVTLDTRTGSGRRAVTVTAPAGTPDGYYEVLVSIRGATGPPVQRSVTVLLAAKGGLVANYNNIGSSDDAETGVASLDNGGNSFSRQELAAVGLTPGAQRQVSGTTFRWPLSPPGRPDNVAANGQTIRLPQAASDASRLVFVGTATNGDHKGTAIVTFTDGSVATTELAFGDWVFPGGGTNPVFGNVVVAHTSRRNPRGPEGAFVFATAPFQVPAGKKVASITLPQNGNLHLFAIGTG